MSEESAHADAEESEPVYCPLCGRGNTPARRCAHVLWTFEQGDPVDFARHALESSPYTRAHGFHHGDISDAWWEEHADAIADEVLLRFAAVDGYVFGEETAIDDLARHLWLEFHPPQSEAASE